MVKIKGVNLLFDHCNSSNGWKNLAESVTRETELIPATYYSLRRSEHLTVRQYCFVQYYTTMGM